MISDKVLHHSKTLKCRNDAGYALTEGFMTATVT